MKKRNLKIKRVSDLDSYIGQKIFEKRKDLGLHRVEFAKRLGVSHQQCQKYEGGINRLAASRLYEIAKLLGVGVDWFFPSDGINFK